MVKRTKVVLGLSRHTVHQKAEQARVKAGAMATNGSVMSQRSIRKREVGFLYILFKNIFYKTYGMSSCCN